MHWGGAWAGLILAFCGTTPVFAARANSAIQSTPISRALEPAPKNSPLIKADAASIEADTRFLADDLLEGREAGTRGDRLTQMYLTSRFHAIGLQPAGDDGTYLQHIRLRSTQLEPNSGSITLTGPLGRRFDNGDDVLIFGHPTEAEQRVVNVPLVFAGYGIVSPRHGLDDYRGLDVRGRIVVLLGGPPAFLPPSDAAHLASAGEQRAAAARRGAIGVVHLWTPALEQRYPFERMRPLLNRRDMAWLDRKGRPQQSSSAIRVSALLHGAAIEAALAAAPKNFDALLSEAKTRSPKGFPLSARLSIARRSRHDDTLVTANVAGLLPGSDPRLRGEIVVLTAHHDHVGIGVPVNGDAIYNGALDNAVGAAMLLDVATRLSAEARPKRAILFLAVGAEEKGLLGSDYFAEHLSGATGSIVANVNLDGAFPFYDFSDVIAFGSEQSDLARHLADAAAELGLTVAPDPFPEESIFTRSDQYSFMKRGIPGVFLYNGFTDMQGRSVGRKVWDDSMERIVHLPADDLKQPIDWQVLAKFSEVFRRLTRRIADAAKRPRWSPDSLFQGRKDR